MNHTAVSTMNTTAPEDRQQPVGQSAFGQDQHLDRERAEERAAEQRVEPGPGCCSPGSPARTGSESRPVRPGETRSGLTSGAARRSTGRGDARDLPVHHQGRAHLNDREHRRARGEPRLHRAWTGETRDIDRYAGGVVEASVDTQGQRDQRADQAGYHQLGRARGGTVLRQRRGRARLYSHGGLRCDGRKLLLVRIRCR